MVEVIVEPGIISFFQMSRDVGFRQSYLYNSLVHRCFTPVLHDSGSGSECDPLSLLYQ